MINPFLWGIGGTLFLFCMTTLGAATVFFFRHNVPPRIEKALLGFAAGVMSAASVWSLLLPAIEQTAQNSHLPTWFPAAIGITLGMLFLSGIDLVLPKLSCLDEGRRQSALLLVAITLHNIPEGMAVGLGFALAQDSAGLYLAAALALGIGIQNFPEGAAISLPLRQHGFSRGKSFLGGMLSGTVEPVFGLLAMVLARGVQALMPWLLSFAAGAMLYVIVVELIPQAKGRSGTVGFSLGFLLMMILDVALG